MRTNSRERWFQEEMPFCGSSVGTRQRQRKLHWEYFLVFLFFISYINKDRIWFTLSHHYLPSQVTCASLLDHVPPWGHPYFQWGLTLVSPALGGSETGRLLLAYCQSQLYSNFLVRISYSVREPVSKNKTKFLRSKI